MMAYNELRCYMRLPRRTIGEGKMLLREVTFCNITQLYAYPDSIGVTLGNFYKEGGDIDG